MATRTFDPSQLKGFLAAEFARFGGLTAEQIDELSRGRTVDVNHIIKAFEIAASKGGVRQPQVRVNGFTFKYATGKSATPGAIFVIEADAGFQEYLGKIYQGKFMPVRACTPEQEKRILAAAANPLEAIIAFGRQTGQCSICSRPLTDPSSVQAGVGPICRAKFGL